ncbi:MAG TPA: hypothetical protein DCE44_01605 [Verrucomicrobiales bacterium]|nr:hypothetical protein [Verrucomicrobiales bacterium]
MAGEPNESLSAVEGIRGIVGLRQNGKDEFHLVPIQIRSVRGVSTGKSRESRHAKLFRSFLVAVFTSLSVINGPRWNIALHEP